MQVALERWWPPAILVQTREKTHNEIQHGADQATPSIRRETNYVEQDESEEIENQNIQDTIQLLRSAILECLEGQHQLADRIQGWYRGHRYRRTQVNLCFVFRFLHVMMKDTSVR